MRPCVGQTKAGDGTSPQRNRLVLDIFTKKGESSICFCPNVRVENTRGKERTGLER